MQTHLGLLVLFAAFVSTVFAVLLRDDPRTQLRFGATLFGAFVDAARKYAEQKQQVAAQT